MTYHVTYRHGPSSEWITRTLSRGEYLVWKAMVAHPPCEWFVIPRPPKRIKPNHPKRYGGQLEGNPIKTTHWDRWGENCRSIERMGDAPPMRRTDVVAAQSGGLSPAQIMAKAKR